jgi:phosphatidylethanolamine-binding protein (PEBP) family uncharacterized protein
MVFFAQKVLRKTPGHWTFVIVTDRTELDDQIYKNFARAGVVTEAQAQPSSAEDLRRLLREDHRYVFTLYAVSARTGLTPGATKPEVLRAIQGKIIAQAELVGTYRR